MDCLSLILSGWSFNHQISLSDVASTLSLVVSGAALYFAVHAGRSVMNDWREQRVSERKAEVASDALAVLLRIAYFLERRTKDVEQPDIHKQMKVDKNWEPFKEMSKDYWRARVNIEAHIPDAQHVLIDFWDSAGQLWVHQQNAGSDSTKFQDAYGEKPMKEVAALRLKVKTALMPYAKHEK